MNDLMALSVEELHYMTHFFVADCYNNVFSVDRDDYDDFLSVCIVDEATQFPWQFPAKVSRYLCRSKSFRKDNYRYTFWANQCCFFPTLEDAVNYADEMQRMKQKNRLVGELLYNELPHVKEFWYYGMRKNHKKVLEKSKGCWYFYYSKFGKFFKTKEDALMYLNLGEVYE